MTNPNNILDSTKHVLGLSDDDTTFDLDVIMHINSAFGDLAQLGVGADTGFVISDNTILWSQYVSQLAYLAMVQQFIYMKVRLAFDPPANSWTMASFQGQVEQLAWRINVAAEHINPPSDPTISSPEEVPESLLFKIKVTTIDFADVITPNAGLYNTFYFTMDDDCTINAPVSAVDGEHITLEITSNGHFVTWGNGWNFGGGGEPSLSNGGVTDIISAVFRESTTEWLAGFTPGF